MTHEEAKAALALSYPSKCLMRPLVAAFRIIGEMTSKRTGKYQNCSRIDLHNFPIVVSKHLSILSNINLRIPAGIINILSCKSLNLI